MWKEIVSRAEGIHFLIIYEAVFIVHGFKTLILIVILGFNISSSYVMWRMGRGS